MQAAASAPLSGSGRSIATRVADLGHSPRIAICETLQGVSAPVSCRPAPALCEPPGCTTKWPPAPANLRARRPSARRRLSAARRSWWQPPRRRGAPPPSGPAARSPQLQPTAATPRWQCSVSRLAATPLMHWCRGWWAAWAPPCCCSTTCWETSPLTRRQVWLFSRHPAGLQADVKGCPGRNAMATLCCARLPADTGDPPHLCVSIPAATPCSCEPKRWALLWRRRPLSPPPLSSG